FAPMPLFAAYGLLTALMIILALVATLAVLPGILVAITSDGAGGGQRLEAAEAVNPSGDPSIDLTAGPQPVHH
ncbi:MAG: hypothetical protein AAFO29_22170, partial [Actinomycetota bacterium]